ncbi:ATP-binding protein [Pricia sp.]|uniref:ATP-binding protein n=1 Tax=Pricia sp. TaxID=2268138 RepID=UPI003593DE1F
MRSFPKVAREGKYRGTGIGLAIVKKIAENHKAFVTATGEPGQGTEINIYLPVKNSGNSGKQHDVG